MSMMRSSLVRGIAWEIGNCILSICRIALQVHSSVVIFKPLGDTLLFVADNFQDIELRDRAHFYYQLLTHVNGEKIRVILATHDTDEEQTGGPRFRLTLAAVLVTTPKGSSRVELVTKEHETFLQLVPSERSPSEDEWEEGEGDLEPEMDGKSAFGQYCQLLSDESFSPTVRKAFDLCYKAQAQIPPSLGSIFGLKISFGASPIYSPIPDVHVPYLALPPNRAGDFGGH